MFFRRPLQQLGGRRLFSCQNNCKLDSDINTRIVKMKDKIEGMFILQGFTYLLSVASITLQFVSIKR